MSLGNITVIIGTFMFNKPSSFLVKLLTCLFLVLMDTVMLLHDKPLNLNFQEAI